MTEEQRTSFNAAAEPLMKWLNENANPHSQALISVSTAELLTCEYLHLDDSHVKD